jgi:hypothetical protein
MPRHSARRFLLEVLFLAGVAAALTYADLRPAAIIGLMAAAWAVVALLEWTAWLDEPHYGRGLPPRYYVPHVALPPPVGVDQDEPAYPVLPHVEDEPTFVASTQEWGIDVAEWPDVEEAGVAEDTVVHPPPSLADDEGVTVVRLPPQIPEIEETVEADVLVPDLDEEEDTAEGEEEHAPVVEIIEVAAVAAAVVEPRSEPRVEPEPPPPPPRAPAPPVELAMPARVTGTAFHRVDPLIVSRRRRFFSRGGDEGPMVEVRDGPPPDRKLPSRVLEESGRR